MRVLLAGVSTRAAAQSAVRAGFDVTTVDAFGDRDQPRSATVIRTGPRFSATAAARRARAVDADAAVYLASFENHPAAVAALARHRVLWGNPPDALARVRDPRELARALAARGFTVPAFRLKAEATDAQAGAAFTPVASAFRRKVSGWIIKPFASGGGNRVREWRVGRHVPAGCHVQELVEGTPGSVVFVAAGGRAVSLGITRQLVGDAAFGADGFRYCGSILMPHAPPHARAVQLASAVGEEFSLTGLNGVDFIERDGEPVPIEVNPRWCASMELVERAHGVPLFALHADACARAVLPGAPFAPPARACGKAIVYAREPVRMPDTTPWLDDPTVADVPQPGEHIMRGSPVCTVFAEAASAADCYDQLVRRAAAVYAAAAPGVLA